MNNTTSLTWNAYAAMRGGVQRLAATRTCSALVSYVHKIIDLPDAASRYAAKKTFSHFPCTLSYPIHSDAQIDRCLDRVVPILKQHLLTAVQAEPTCTHVLSWCDKMWERIRTALAWKKIPTFSEVLQQQSDALIAQVREQLKTQILIPAVSSLQSKSIEYAGTLALQFFYSCALRSLASTYFHRSLQVYDSTRTVVTVAEIGLLAYVWGPLLYQCGKIAHMAYHKQQRLNQIEEELLKWQRVIQRVTQPLGVSDESYDWLIKPLALALSELPPLNP